MDMIETRIDTCILNVIGGSTTVIILHCYRIPSHAGSVSTLEELTLNHLGKVVLRSHRYGNPKTHLVRFILF